jgi:hypothetical protein
VVLFVFKEMPMQIDWSPVIAKTDLKNQECILSFLERANIGTLKQLGAVPARFSKPWICEVGTHEIVSKLYEAYHTASDEIPVVDDVVVEVEEAEEENSQPHPLKDMDLPNVQERHIDALIDAGFHTGEDVVQYENHLTEIPGIKEKTAEKIVNTVKAALDIPDIQDNQKEQEND